MSSQEATHTDAESQVWTTTKTNYKIVKKIFFKNQKSLFLETERQISAQYYIAPLIRLINYIPANLYRGPAGNISWGIYPVYWIIIYRSLNWNY